MTPNNDESDALLEKARYRLQYVKNKEVDKINAQFILEDAYESIREAAQSLMSIKGYKPYSHEATIAFLKDYHKEFDEEEIYRFDRYRQLRNNSIYKAEPVSVNDAKSCVLFATIMINKIRQIK